MIGPDRLARTAFKVSRAALADLLYAVRDAAAAWIAREDERAASACNGPEDVS